MTPVQKAAQCTALSVNNGGGLGAVRPRLMVGAKERGGVRRTGIVCLCNVEGAAESGFTKPVQNSSHLAVGELQILVPKRSNKEASQPQTLKKKAALEGTSKYFYGYLGNYSNGKDSKCVPPCTIQVSVGANQTGMMVKI